MNKYPRLIMKHESHPSPLHYTEAGEKYPDTVVPPYRAGEKYEIGKKKKE